jgi:hypothetical protein
VRDTGSQSSRTVALASAVKGERTMKKTLKPKKLQLDTRTLRPLQDHELRPVAGGGTIACTLHGEPLPNPY